MLSINLLVNLIFQLLVLTTIIKGQRYEGDVCILTASGERGICEKISNCSSALNNLKNGIVPQTCSYERDEVIVCCANSFKQSTSISNRPVFNSNRPTFQNSQSQSSHQRPTINSNEPPFSNRPPTKRLSVQKCEEYGRLGIRTDSFITLSVDPDIDSVDIPVCEYVQNTGLIAGGLVTSLGEFPHMAAIGWSDGKEVEFKCGGSLISDEFVLTAAHCVKSSDLPDVIRLGDQNLKIDDDDSNAENFGIGKIIRHPGYRPPSKYNDIALIKLNRKVTFSKFIRPACLWQNFHVNSSTVIATGWGAIFFSGPNSDDLLKVSLELISNAECDPLYERRRELTDGIISSQICAGYHKEGRDTCEGDSGGPIQLVTGDNQCLRHIVGITSFSKSCAIQDFGVYTRVSSYLDWIESNVWL